VHFDEEPTYVPPDFHAKILAEAPDAAFEATPGDGLVPKAFYASTNYPTYVKYQGQWHLVRRQRMDAALVLDPESGEITAVELRNVRGGQPVVVGLVEDGSTGVLVYTAGFRHGPGTAEPFGFMSSGPSRERPLNYRRLARLVARNRAPHGRSIWVLGPAVVHSGAREAISWLIENGYVWAIFGGNAVATHDIEHALYGTALGMDAEGMSVAGGHRHHMDAINTVRHAGSIAAAVEAGTISNGVMYSAVKASVPYLLAGSIRDDGPLPEVITDAVEAQERMRGYTCETTLVVMIATMLHSIATGNMLPTFTEDHGTIRPVYTIAVDAAENVLTKLVDRGSHQAIGIVRNADDFVVRLVHELQRLEAAEKKLEQ
jgi:lysine-ketoglutarate reductase/saccharopine dehydrogenase-like protein (TIGR00300 family)